MFNIALDNLPERVRVPLAEKLEVHCPDFKFSKAIFEKQFSKIMSLLNSKSRQPVTSMYAAQISNSPTTNLSNNVSETASKNNHQPQYHGSNRGRGRGRGRGKGGGRQYVPSCTLCYPQRHPIHECKFKTPQQKRERLVNLGRCQACGVMIREHGMDCSHRVRCSHHPGERHIPWTCEGEEFKHP